MIEDVLQTAHSGGHRRMAWHQVRLLQSKQAVVCSLVVQWLRIWLPVQGTPVRIPGLGESHMPLSTSPCAATLEPAAL